MTDKLLEGLAAQAANMAKADLQLRGQINGVLANYFEGQGLHRMRTIETLLEQNVGKDWLNLDGAKHHIFGVLCYGASLITPDALVVAFAANAYYSNAAGDKVEKVPGDRLIAIAQTKERVCLRDQEIRGRLVIGEPRIMFVDQADWKGRLKLYGEAPPEIVREGERILAEMVRQEKTPLIPPDSPLAPKYWMHESSGALKGPVTRLINNAGLSADDILVIRAYLRQWIDSPVWDESPGSNYDSRRALADMRSRVRRITSRREIDEWIALAVDQGMDPL